MSGRSNRDRADAGRGKARAGTESGLQILRIGTGTWNAVSVLYYGSQSGDYWFL